MNILAIDYGEKKLGVAFADSHLADPLMVIRYESLDYLIKKLKDLIEEKKVEKIIIGVSEGQMEIKTKEFGKILKQNLDTDVEFEDETLTSKEANTLAHFAKIRRSKLKGMEDAYAAAIILQNYLDRNP
jgi:putative Holliday junction resolvase